MICFCVDDSQILLLCSGEDNIYETAVAFCTVVWEHTTMQSISELINLQFWMRNVVEFRLS